PSVRLADRYAFALGGVAVLLAGTSWILTGDSARCLAVLVVATPCPLILAVPVAIVSGLSRCAKRGVLVKGGGALERLALADTLFFDKTGTLTSGFARLVDVECAPHYASDVVLGLAGSIAQASNHVTAEAVAKAAREQGAKLRLPSGVVESPG
ncbi:heavy metal translocating P-type ATPase, partial [Klebsiella oxytoca]